MLELIKIHVADPNSVTVIVFREKLFGSGSFTKYIDLKQERCQVAVNGLSTLLERFRVAVMGAFYTVRKI